MSLIVEMPLYLKKKKQINAFLQLCIKKGGKEMKRI